MVCHKSDPGYIIPSQQLFAKGTSDSNPACRKCECVKLHARVHHCGRCNRCVDFMDHHCLITDNCVGKENFKYFFHFTSWAAFTIMCGIWIMIWHVYTYN